MVQFNLIMHQHTIKHFGFTTPPYGTMDDILNQIDFNGSKIFYIIDPLTGTELPYDEIKSLPKENLFVIIQTGEGHSHHFFDKLLNLLINYSCVPASHITTYTGCLYDPESPVNHISMLAHCSIVLNEIGSQFKSITPTHHYVCLNREKRWQRYAIVEQLLDRNLDQFGKISYGSAYAPRAFYDSNVSARYRDRFPMYINENKKVDFDQGYSIESTDITGAFFNIATESSFESDPKQKMLPKSQIQPTLSEKTYKAFILGQVPILVSPQYTVRATRKLGFDMFDDIVDHDLYDLESDPVKRIKLIVDQIEKICNMSLTDLIKLKEQVYSRLENNFKRLQYLGFNVTEELVQWKSYFKNLGVVN
jgi:hypothetical protein